MKKNKYFLKVIYFNLVNLGFDPIRFFLFLRGFATYLIDFFKLYRKIPKEFKICLRPVFFDKFDKSGILSGHYFHQDLFVARRIFLSKPRRHLDIGSRTDGFVAHVACFMPIEILDIRDQISKVENIKFKRADLMNINTSDFEKYQSISCLHSIEHFGLGRYGDPLNIEGHLIAFENIYELLDEGGIFYFSTIFGEMRIEFNAHRVFSLKYLLNWITEKYIIESFSYVDDEGDFHQFVELSDENISINYNQNYSCAIFELRKAVHR
jgi:hypothetical protein